MATTITKGPENQADPLISVVIPCYNDGGYLPETLQRLSLQTFSDFEIIIVNDGSNDQQTLDILKQISEEGKATVLHKVNGRMSSARNHGVRHARGKIIAALDSDDYFHPSFFKKALAILEKEPDTAVVTSYIQLFGEFRAVGKPRGNTPFNQLFSSQIPAVAIVRKHCFEEVGGYDEEMKQGYEDWEFYIRIYKKGWNIRVIPQKLLFYRQTKKSTLKNDTGPSRSALIGYIVDKHRDWYLENLKDLMTRQEVIYTETRISYQRIFKMLKDRLTNRYP